MRPLPSMRQTNFALISTALALPSFAARPQLSTATVSLLMASTFFFFSLSGAGSRSHRRMPNVSPSSLLSCPCLSYFSHPFLRWLSLSSPHAERVALKSLAFAHASYIFALSRSRQLSFSSPHVERSALESLALRMPLMIFALSHDCTGNLSHRQTPNA